MANQPLGQFMDVEPTSGHACYMCGNPSTTLIHDARGCKPVCDAHLTWRMQQSYFKGHEPDCYKHLATTNNPVRESQEPETAEGAP